MMKEVLIPLELKRERWGWPLLTALCLVALLLFTVLTTLSYQKKLEEMEMRLKFLEKDSILKENEKFIEEHPIESGHRDKREARQNDQHLTRNDHEETFFTRRRDGSYVSPSGLREMYERLPPAYSQEVNPPPMYHTPRAQAPQVQTRAGAGQRGERVQPPIQRVGDASARVIRYKDEDDTVAAHFVADVSNFTSNQNPRLRNSNGIFQIWRPEQWMKDGNFHLENMEGIVTVQKGGLYHIYAQIHYHDENLNSFLVEVSRGGAPFLPFLQCTTNQGSNSCYSAGLTQLRSRDRILIKNVGVDRFSIYKPEKSFFGLLKVSN